MVYLDPAGHLVADTLDELHAFAQRIGLRRQWFQDKRLSHYDLTTQRNKAIRAGAQSVTSREVVRLAAELKKGGSEMPDEGGRWM